MHHSLWSRPSSRQLETLQFIVGGVFVLLLISGMVLWLADIVGLMHWLRPWEQISGTFAALVLVGLACWQTPGSLWSRMGYITMAVLCLGTVIDSLDGFPDVFPIVSLGRCIWVSNFQYEVRKLVRESRPSMWQRTVGIALGVLSIVIYTGAAGYYIVLNRLHGPVTRDHHVLFACGFVVSRVLSYLQQQSSAERPPVTPETER